MMPSQRKKTQRLLKRSSLPPAPICLPTGLLGETHLVFMGEGGGGWPVLPTLCKVSTEESVCASSVEPPEPIRKARAHSIAPLLVFSSYNGSCLSVRDVYSQCLSSARCFVNTC